MTDHIRKSFGYIDDHLYTNCTKKKLDLKIIFDKHDLIPNKFKIMTYNIWGLVRGTGEKQDFVKQTMKLRMEKIRDIIIDDEPDIVCIQEMTNTSFEYLKDLKNKYKCCIEPNINSELNKCKRNRDVEVFIFSKYYPKMMKLYSINGNLGYDNCFMIIEFDNLIIFNCYLQSGSKYSPGHHDNSDSIKQYSRCRAQQINIIKNHIKRYNKPIIVVGDFNTHLGGKINEWPELDILHKCKLKDTWIELKKTEEGYTEDTDINNMRWNIKFIHKKVRFDGILYKCKRAKHNIKPTDVKLLGTMPIILDNNMTELFKKYFINEIVNDTSEIRYQLDGKLALWPSDHFAISCSFCIKSQ